MAASSDISQPRQEEIMHLMRLWTVEQEAWEQRLHKKFEMYKKYTSKVSWGGGFYY